MTNLNNLLHGYGSLLALSVGKYINGKLKIFMLPLNHTKEDYEKFLMEQGEFDLDSDDSAGAVLFNEYGAFFYSKIDGDFCEDDEHWLNFPRNMDDIYTTLEHHHGEWVLDLDIEMTSDTLDLEWYHQHFCKNNYYRLRYIPHEAFVVHFKETDITMVEYHNYLRILNQNGGTGHTLLTNYSKVF